MTVSELSVALSERIEISPVSKRMHDDKRCRAEIVINRVDYSSAMLGTLYHPVSILVIPTQTYDWNIQGH